MKYWTTIIIAMDPNDGETKTYGGPHVPGLTKKDAHKYCQENGLGYCNVDMELVYEMEADGDIPNWNAIVASAHLN